MKKDLIAILTQAFYGNRTATEVRRENLDDFILGYLEPGHSRLEEIAREIVPVPNTENLVIIYNPLKEIERLEDKVKWERKDGYILKSLAAIPEKNVEIYSRCIACRIDEDGQLQSLQAEDYMILTKYFAA